MEKKRKRAKEEQDRQDAASPGRMGRIRHFTRLLTIFFLKNKKEKFLFYPTQCLYPAHPAHPVKTSRILPILFFLFILAVSATGYADVAYSLQFEGIPPKSDIEEVLNATSQLRLLQEHPPATMAALRRRAEADLPNLMDGLQSLGYYDPHIEFTIDTPQEEALVTLHIEPGALFYFESVSILYPEEEVIEITPEMIGFQLGSIATPLTILEGEKHLLNLLTNAGYPQASIVKREVLANRLDQSISIIYHILPGRLSYFGPAQILGLQNVDEDYVRGLIRWKEGEIFNPALIEKTQIEIESTSLFGLVTIHQGEYQEESDLLPIIVEVAESKHRTISAGLSYTTQLGPGVMFEWENRNILQKGRKISFRTNLWLRRQMAYLSYRINNFLDDKQDLFLIAEVEREITKGYDEAFVSLSSLLELQITEDIQLSYGPSLKQLKADKSDNDNKQFTLIKFPLHVRYSTANHLLNPTDGLSVNYKFIPTTVVSSPRFAYAINFMTLATYYPLTQDNFFVLAAKVSIGNIFGAKKHDIPPPERFYAGSESLLRGYRYQTVSPLGVKKRDKPLEEENHDEPPKKEVRDKPLGGLSLLIGSLELRAQFSSSWGAALFWDIGNVYAKCYPQLDHKQLQSVGGGIRYFTAVGPLRFDVAFPLNKRSKLDSSVQFYFSIGQAF